MNAKLKNNLATITFWVGAGLVLLILGTLLGYIFYHGLKSIDWQFITSPPETIRAGGGIGPQIFNSFYILFLTMIISIPMAYWQVSIWRNMPGAANWLRECG